MLRPISRSSRGALVSHPGFTDFALRSVFATARPALVGLVGLVGLLTATTPAAAQHFDEIASELADGLNVIDTSVLPDLSNDGRIVFTGAPIGLGANQVYVGTGEGLVSVDLTSFSNLRNVEIDSLGDVAWTADRLVAGINYRGVYRAKVTPGIPAPYPRFTVYQGRILPYAPLQPPARSPIALTSHGEILFSSLTNGDGGLYKGPIEGTQALFVEGSGTYYNNLQLDLNETGEVAVQLEYSDPILNLARAIFVFDAPLQLREDARTAVEKLGIGEQYAPDLNNAGQVAFVVSGSPTMTFYDPPDDPDGAIVAEIDLSPGVWLATPTSFGLPPSLTQLVDTTSGYLSISRVLLDDFGRIVFSATKDDGVRGVYSGPDPVADKLLEEGDVVEGRQLASLVLAKGNDWGQFTLIARDGFTLDRQVWRVTPIPTPEPGAGALLAVGSTLLASLAKSRRPPSPRS